MRNGVTLEISHFEQLFSRSPTKSAHTFKFNPLGNPTVSQQSKPCWQMATQFFLITFAANSG